MAITNGYVTFEEFQEWSAGQTISKVAVAERAIETASRWIEEHCQRHFWKTTAVARTFEATSGWRLEFGRFNDLVSITSLATDSTGDGTFDTVWDAADYQLDPHNPPEGRPYTAVEAIGGRLFPGRCGRRGRRDRVQITGVWGWAAVPTEVTQACLLQASRIYKRKESPEGVAGFGDFGPIRVGRVDPDVAEELAALRHPDTLLVA